jgi:CheY-like chemotaxis protein
MSKLTHLKIEDIYGSRIKTFQKLMKHKVRDILLVSSLYDNYLFEEDGQLYELIRKEADALNLSHAPDIMHVTTGEEAIELASSGYDLIITTLHIEDMHVTRFAQRLREIGIDTPIVLLAYDNRERKEIETHYDTSLFDRIFIWQGDFRLILAIIKDLEDRKNVEEDTLTVGVQSILLVEDSVKFYSMYLPILYTVILDQTKTLIQEGVNLTHRMLRMKARPKILLCHTYEQAWSYIEKYQDFILGIISDVNFKRQGKKDSYAGIDLAKNVRHIHQDIPILLQSSNPVNAERAREIGVSFLMKNSPRLLHELREFSRNNFGFGDFIFRTPDGREVGRATNLKQLQERLRVVPDESISYHGSRNHFSSWLKARTEFWLAARLRPHKVTDFASITDLRNELINSLELYLQVRQRGIVADFNPNEFDPQNTFARIGEGSLGGKARGLGFLNQLINNYSLRNQFEGVQIAVPSAIVVATDIFDEFLKVNNLETFALSCTNDEELYRRFAETTHFPPRAYEKLRQFLEIIRDPVAVRSSSLLEDSQYQPFAGVYQTYMIPNNHPDIAVRLAELLRAIKYVYASTFDTTAKDYMKATTYRLEEEKMAVIIQRIVGSKHDGKFYPEFAGVAKSFNFYPIPPQKNTDGIVHVALGLGKYVVEGGNTVRFCPKYPRHVLQFYSTKETLKNAQQNFFALDLNAGLASTGASDPASFVRQYALSAAEEDQTLFYVGSTYSAENDTVYDGVSRPGRRVVTFAPILKHKLFPLAEILDAVLELGTWGIGTPVEIEFAVNMHVPEGAPKEFCFLQIRPLVLGVEVEDMETAEINPDDVLVESTQVLGNGVLRDIRDIVFVDINKYDRGRSRDVAREIAAFNAQLVALQRQYILIGVGRWGSKDEWLGIPVSWDQISGAAVIVESSFRDFDVTPSQGTHFFQNITSFRIGYFTVNSFSHLGSIDWEWLTQQAATAQQEFTTHLRFENPLTVRINGRKNIGVIFKPS